MLKEFRDFVLRGNVLDLAVGIIIGAAFTAVVTSLVNDVIMPPIGVIIGGIDFSNIGITLRAGDAAAGVEPVVIGIGKFINAIIIFLITALAVFLLIKSVNAAMKRMQRQKAEEAAAAPPAPSVDEKLLVTLDRLNANLERMESAPPVVPPAVPR